MKSERLLAIVAVVGAIVGVAFWRCRSEPAKSVSTASGSGSVAKANGASATTGIVRVDPTTLAKGSISGTIRDERGSPIANAIACADFWAAGLSDEQTQDPICATADGQGVYAMKDLIPATYSVDASAKGFVPATYRAGDETSFTVGPGEAKTQIDLVLKSGGVEVTGTVSDISGGGIEGARVTAVPYRARVRSQAIVTTDKAGKYSLWVAPGPIDVHAVAEGYVKVEERGRAPGTFDFRLTPESSIGGTVVLADTGEPVAGVGVYIFGSEFTPRAIGGNAITDAKGRFRVTRLVPMTYGFDVKSGGYRAVVTSTVVLGLGEHLDDVVIRVERAAAISGKVLVKGTDQPCAGAHVALHPDNGPGSTRTANASPDGTALLDSVAPGKYGFRVECDKHQPAEAYALVTVEDKDLTGLVWYVAEANSLEGKVVGTTGAPLTDVEVSLDTSEKLVEGARKYGTTDANPDGTFRIDGLAAVKYTGTVTSARGAPLKFEIDIARGVNKRDFTIEDGGTIQGTVVDEAGKPVQLFLTATAEGMPWRDATPTERDGRFEIAGLASGRYTLTGSREERDEVRTPAGKRTLAIVEVKAGARATVKLVVESLAGTIRGSVVDAAGAPVGDAYVAAVRESADEDATNQLKHTFGETPRLTAPDGSFVLTELAKGSYTVRAYRKGGGDAFARNVALGSTVKLKIAQLASVSGKVTVAGGGPPDTFQVQIGSNPWGGNPRAGFYKAGGAFEMKDLAPGTHELRVTSKGGEATRSITLDPGEHETVEIVLQPKTTISGTVIDYTTKQPLAGVEVMIVPRGPMEPTITISPEENPNVTKADGKFLKEGSPTGGVVIVVWNPDIRDLWSVRIPRTIAVAPTTDLGAVAVMKPRAKYGVAGELGYTIVDDPNLFFDDRFQVAKVMPGGPAAKAGLKSGDVIVRVDGIDVTGDHAGHYPSLVMAAPGTKLAIGLESGTTVELVVGPPPKQPD